MTQVQNKFYFTNEDNIVIQNDGLAMGAPSCGNLSEILLQYTEALHITQLTKKHMIINYFRYVLDILITFISYHRNIQANLTDFNNIVQNFYFTTEEEQSNKTNYLDISI